VAKTVAPDAKHEIIGIRPGEKLPEEMITASDFMNTIEFDDYFVIVPSIREWSKSRFKDESNGEKGTPCLVSFSYNSGSNEHFLTVEELRH